MENPEEQFVVLLSFNHMHELAVVRGRLEADGIVCFVKDELINQAIPLYGGAIGGVKLLVKAGDLHRAVEVLQAYGYLSAEKEHPAEPEEKADWISRIPFLQNLSPPYRILALAIAAALLFFLAGYYITKPSTKEVLTANTWCVDELLHKGASLTPDTRNFFYLDGPGFCRESIAFRNNGFCQLPGFQSSSASGRWHLKDGNLIIKGVDSFKSIYEGTYQVQITGRSLSLTSATTTIRCRQPK